MSLQLAPAHPKPTEALAKHARVWAPSDPRIRLLALLDGSLRGSDLARACDELERALAPAAVRASPGCRARRWRVREPGGRSELATAAVQALSHPIRLELPAIDWFDGLAEGRGALSFPLPEREAPTREVPLSAAVAARLPLPVAYFGRVARGLFAARNARAARVTTRRAPPAAARPRALALASLEPGPIACAKARHGCADEELAACVIAGGLHRYLRSRGVALRSLELPVLRWSKADCARAIELPVDVENDVLRLAVVRRALREPERRRQGCAVAYLLHGPAARLELCGRRIDALWPISTFGSVLGLAIGAVCYGGGLYLGLQADDRHGSELEKLRRDLEESLDALGNEDP